MAPRYSDTAQAFFESRAISEAGAMAAGVREIDGTLAFSCVAAEGSTFSRLRDLNGAGPAKVRQPPGTPLALWRPLRRPDPGGGQNVLVCEGETDGLAAVSTLLTAEGADSTAGRLLAESALHVCAAPGASFPAGRLAAELSAMAVRTAYLAFDGDEAGRRASEHAAEALRRAGVRVCELHLPDGRDLADCLADATDRSAWLAGALLEGDAAAEERDDAGHDVNELRFASPAELRAVVPDEPNWIWRDYLAPGTITLAAGKPKAGKSTLACALAEAVAVGAPTFLGRQIRGGPVVYVSEEGAATLLPKLPDDDRLRVLTRERAWPKPTWTHLVAAATEEALRVGAVLLVVDTFAYWAGLAAERKQDAGAVHNVLAALVEAARHGLAVLLVHHQRKAPGAEGDAIRGSGAFAGTADVLMEIERVGEEAPATHRRLVAIGRWPDIPPVLVVDRDPATEAWRVVGEATDRSEAAALPWRERLLRALPTHEPGSTQDEICEVLGVDRRKWSPTPNELVDEGLVLRVGEGRAHAPYHYRLPAAGVRPECPPESGADTALGSPPAPLRGRTQQQTLPAASGAESGDDGAPATEVDPEAVARLAHKLDEEAIA